VDVIDGQLELVAERTVGVQRPESVLVEKPGRYLVRAIMPSGEQVSTNVTVPPQSGEVAFARLSPKESSPQETMAWAYATQGVTRAAAPVRPMVGATRSEKTQASPFRSSTQFLTTYEIAAWDEAEGFWRFREHPGVKLEDSLPPPEDGRVVVRRQLVETSWVDPREWRPSFQRYQVGSNTEEVRLFAVPPGGRADMLLVDASEEKAKLLRPMVRGGDPQADALLSYLGQGAFELARRSGNRLVEQLEMMLNSKESNPSGAVVAGYYMLKATGVFLQYQTWLQNLANWFTRIPDGAVIYGWCHLYLPSPSHAGAREYYLQAVRRGIPMYSVGLRMLQDGLKFCYSRDRTDTEVERALNAVMRVADTMDKKADVTSFTLPASLFKTE
jgi:hypothetical protein